MTDYLAKSHEEKLKTLALLREKDSHIQASRMVSWTSSTPFINLIKCIFLLFFPFTIISSSCLLAQKLTKELESFKAGALTTTSSLANTVSSSPMVSSSSSSSSAATAAKDSFEDKLVAYQRFIANYVIKAQEEKFRAIQRAEAALEKKYQDKIQFLLQQSPPNTIIADKRSTTTDMPVLKGTTTTTTPATSGTPTTTAASTPTPITTPATRVNIGAAIAKGQFSTSSTVEPANDSLSTPPLDISTTTPTPTSSRNNFFEMRNTKLLEMAKEGRQIRWGEAEIQKLQKLTLNSSPSQPQPTSTPTTISNTLNAPTTITLQERLKFGAKLQPTTLASPLPESSSSASFSTNLESLYYMRSAKVVESANAGKTRWGDAEIQKIKPNSNHSPTTTTIATTSLEKNDNLYHMRTTKVIESANAGKTRWGDAEIQKLSSSTAMDSTTSGFQPLTSAATFLTQNNHVINVGAILLSSYLLLGLNTAWASY
jgi:hypothetical protein